MTAGRSRSRTLVLGVLMMGISSALAAALSEVALRVVFRDGGRTTLAGPGGQEFEYTYVNAEQLRGPLATGPKAPGVQRIMVMGDSITWGQGVRRWEDTYPPKTLAALNADGTRYDMAVYAYAGKEIDNHLATIEKAIPEVNPDIVVYQWYNNDVEISKAGRPRSQRAWRSLPWHEALRRWSYLYFVLDFALDARLPAAGRTYVQYLEEDFADGTPGWTAFARTFHDWAAYATGYATRTIMLLYPPLPMTALTDLRARVTRLGDGQTLAAGPHDLTRVAGEIADDPASPSGRVLAAPAGTTGLLASTRGIALAHGDYALTVHLKSEGGAMPIARVSVLGGDDAVLGTTEVLASSSGWHTATVRFHVADRVAPNVQTRIEAMGAAVGIGRIELPVHYGIEVVDLGPPLSGITTAASPFDAHPNAAAHAVMAEVLAAQIRHAPATPPPTR